ncbi:MAG: diguanylate cyclase [Actinobacteria bacterium]|nr:diguanylate cyclase [Actinomycetota bacterium]
MTAIILGALGLLAGAGAVALDAPWLGIVAGLAALATGVIAFGLASLLERTEVPNVGHLDDADTVAGLRRELAQARMQLDEARSAQSDQGSNLGGEPAAGSFARKLDDTSPALAVGSPDLADTRLLADPETNLFSEAYFRVALDARIASARRHLRPVAIALVQVVEGTDPNSARGADPQKVTGSIRQTLRDADTACRMTDGSYAIILEDTPENGAVWTVERIRRNLTNRYGHHTMWAGVACYPAHAFSTEELLDQATVALGSAQEWKQDRIEVATSE